MKFRVRIDETSTCKPEMLAAWTTKNSADYVVMHHLVNKNSHFHLYMDSPNILSCQAMRYKVKTVFKLEPVEFSVGICDETRITEYLSYLYNSKHGNVATLLTTNLSEEIMQVAMESALAIGKEFLKTKKEKAKGMYEIALECVKEVNKLEYHSQPWPELHQGIYIVCVKQLHKYCKCHDSFLVNKLVETVLSHRDPDKYATDLYKTAIDKMERTRY